MAKTSAFEMIARRFHISNESAKYFLGQVQKSYKTERPSHQLIAEFITGQKWKTLPVPYQVAIMMNDSGVWAHPMVAPPPEIADEEDMYF